MKRFLTVVMIFMLCCLNCAIAEISLDTKKQGIWKNIPFVDEFELPTGDYYIGNEEPIVGKFSNSATTDSPLLVYIAITDSHTNIRLVEYGSDIVKNPFSEPIVYSTAIMDTNGEKQYFDGYMLSGTDSIFYLNSCGIIDALYEGGTVRISITEEGNPTTKYLFAIEDASGLVPPYDTVNEFCEGLAIIETENDKCGYVDVSGDLVIPCVYTDARAFNEGLAAVKFDGKWGFIDKNGSLVIQCQYDDAFVFSEGLAAVIQDGKCGFIDTNGDIVIPFEYTNGIYREGYFSEGLVAVKKGDKWGYVDVTGATVIPFTYDYAYPFECGLARVKKDESWGFIDVSGATIIPFEYDYSYSICADWPCSFSEGLSRVQKNGKWGYINTEGIMVIPCIFDNAFEFSEGYAAICKDDKWGFIDTTGKIVIPCEFDAVFQSFRGGYAKVYSKYDPVITSWGLIDKTGEWVFAENYEYSNYNEGYFSLINDGELIIQRQETPIDIPMDMDTVIGSSKVRENYDALLKEAIIEKYNAGDYDTALLFIADISELDAEIVSIKEDIEKHNIAAYCIDGDLNGALDYISGIAEKSDGILAMESEIIGFMEQYGKWLGKWGYRKNEDRCSLWIKGEYTNDGLILRFEEGKTKQGETIVFYLHESKKNTLVYHSNEYDVFAYTSLKYVEDGTITTSTYNKTTDHTTSPSKLYRID